MQLAIRNLLAAALLAPFAAPAATPPVLQVGGTTYEHRWNDGDLHEYTPTGQDDLEAYSDMLTFVPSLPMRTTAELEAYTEHMGDVARQRGGDVLSSRCAPADASHVADCTMLVVYSKDDHVEVAVAKHLGAARSIVPILFSHREYGQGAGARATAWIGSPEGSRAVAEFIDWVDAMGLRIDER